LSEVSAVQDATLPAPPNSQPGSFSNDHRPAAYSVSLRSVARTLWLHRRFVGVTLGSLLLGCLLYCLVAPNQYDARARLALRIAPGTPIHIDGDDASAYSGSFASGQTQLETLANVFRSDQLAWRVILDLQLYRNPAFSGRFTARFPDFHPDSPAPAAQAWLLERFQDRLHVRTIPRTLLLEIRFRSGDPALSADVVNRLIRAYQSEESDDRIVATAQASGWLQDQLRQLKAKADRDDQHLAEFQRKHGLLIAPQTLANGQAGSSQHISSWLQVDELSRDLVAAGADRILREAAFRAASQGDPETVLASDPRLESESGGLSAAAFRQLRARRSDLEQEQAQLAAEHGPSFPRVVEIRDQLTDLDHQLESEDARLRERFRLAFQSAAEREQMLRKALAEQTGAGQKASEAATQYEAMRREADSSRELYLRMQGKVAEAGLAAGVSSPDFRVVDPAHPPAKPAAPDLPLYMAITLFAGLWLATGTVFLMESLRPTTSLRDPRVLILVAILAGTLTVHAQAPTPSTSGLPTGVARIPQSRDTRAVPNPKESPMLWNGQPATPTPGSASATAAVPGPIAPGDLLDVSEFHIPEFRSSVRVSSAGSITLPLIGDIPVSGLDEPAAARAVGEALVAKGMLLHPQVNVLITSSVDQDVTVLGEVLRPGVYPYGAHHRLLDLISSASGLSPTAGSVISIAHRDSSTAPVLVALDAAVTASATQNPELQPGDTVQVGRAGVVYVVGDVIRPGGFTMEPAQPMTVLQALSLAWGPSPNAALKSALLIHAHGDGRTVTTLNLHRMLRGLDPDLPIAERDILFVPDSAAKNLWNRTMESVVQSAAGVSIYAGLVYSQRF